jgi:hypothetical protein
MGRDLFMEFGVAPSDEGRDLFAEAGISPKKSAEERARKANEAFIEASKPKEPTFGEKALATGAAALTGLAAPMAGAAEYLGIKRPAQLIKEVSETTGQIAPVAAPVAEFAGSVASPMPTKIGNVAAGLLPKAQTLARMATQGAVGAAFNPLGTAEDKDYLDFLSKKAGQIGEGGIFGGVLGKSGQAIMNPQVSARLQMLKDMGMKYFTPGQLASQIPLVGTALREGEAKSTSIPFVGSAIEKGIRTAASDMNKAMVNKVLGNMSEKVPKNIKAGDEMIDYMNQRIANAYDEIIPKLHISNLPYKDPTSSTGFTTTTKSLVDKLRDVTQDLPSDPKYDLAGMVRNEFDKHILLPLTQKGSLTGEEFRNAEKNLGNVAFRYSKNPELHDVGVALRELQGELRKELIYQNPQLADKLRGIHNAFIQHLPIERAAGYVGAEGRVFSPSQLQSAVRAEAKGKGKFASGKGAFYPESQASLEVLGKNIPDSGTAGRLGWATLPFHGWGTIPAALGASAIYNRPVMGALSTLATGKRPDIIRSIEPAISGGIARGTGQSLD